jgi:hypothetical protein
MFIPLSKRIECSPSVCVRVKDSCLTCFKMSVRFEEDAKRIQIVKEESK